ncbi:MAG: hypothetical protein LN573_03880 [Rickettsia endosymbiont of Oxypoda opaca]|nr:hypothetical protein [Rickettsia endosymbiont of Oxypoda opaca]
MTILGVMQQCPSWSRNNVWGIQATRSVYPRNNTGLAIIDVTLNVRSKTSQIVKLI